MLALPFHHGAVVAGILGWRVSELAVAGGLLSSATRVLV